ncbi:MAG: hypothetical protein IJN82_05895, partial [Clostridia bacterium]|nr:hypothetical protein [Clostridia bacterium]
NGESDRPEQVEKKAFEYIESIEEHGIDEERFKEIRNGLYGALILETEQAYGMVNRLVGNAMNGAETFDSLEALQQITVEDLLARAREMFDRKRCCMSVIKPIKEDA